MSNENPITYIFKNMERLHREGKVQEVNKLLDVAIPQMDNLFWEAMKATDPEKKAFLLKEYTDRIMLIKKVVGDINNEMVK